MRAHDLHPPAAHYPLKPDRVLVRVLVCAWGALGVSLLAWRWAQAFDAWRYQPVWLAGGVAWLWAGGMLWRWYRRLPQGWLIWTGLHWRLERLAPQQDAPDSDETGSKEHANAHDPHATWGCHVALDLQVALLLRLEAVQAQGRPATCWLWVVRTQAPQHWHALRCAVYGSQAARQGSAAQGAA